MRLLLINYEYPPIGAGAATATAAIARAAAAMGHQVTVLTSGFEENVGWSTEEGVAVCRVRSRRARADHSSVREMGSYVSHAAFALPGVVRKARPQACIVFFSLPCGPLGLLFRLVARAPYIVSLRGGDVPGTEPGLASMHRSLAWLRRWVLRSARAVVANSRGLADLSERADPVRVVVIPNGVDLERFSPGAADAARAPYCFLFVGRLNEQKNVTLLLEAASELRSRGAKPFRLTIVGDGPLRARLMEQAQAAALEQVVEWIPWLPRERMPDAYRSASCVVNPSHYEGMPNVVLEAMACAVPVIVSDVAGNRDVVVHGEVGLVVPHNDREALVAAMQRAMDEPEAFASMGRNARAHVTAHYSWNAAAAQYLAMFPGR